MTPVAQFCPDCGQKDLRLIEQTEPNIDCEYKDIMTCDSCENLVYMVRRLPEDETYEPHKWTPQEILEREG